MLKVEINY